MDGRYPTNRRRKIITPTSYHIRHDAETVRKKQFMSLRLNSRGLSDPSAGSAFFVSIIRIQQQKYCPLKRENIIVSHCGRFYWMSFSGPGIEMRQYGGYTILSRITFILLFYLYGTCSFHRVCSLTADRYIIMFLKYIIRNVQR